MTPNRDRSRPIVRRLMGAGLALAVFGMAVQATGAGAVTKTDVQNAKAKAEELQRQVDALQVKLGDLGNRLSTLADQVAAAQQKLDEVNARLDDINRGLAEARAQYEELRARLDQRARLAYINGPGSSLEFLLGSTSLGDLSDRLAFVNALQQNDGDLATAVQNQRNELLIQQAQAEDLKAERTKALANLNARQAELAQEYAQFKSLEAEAEKKQAAADAYAKQVGKKYQQQLAALAQGDYSGSVGKGTFKVCPVGPGHVVTDSFGAPRYAGGYHLHLGDDIMADFNTPIYAPFDGTASDASNGLGGYAVVVHGAEGWVYNAHLIGRPVRTGGVSAGTLIGYVGNSGDASGGPPHDHFEWHPNSVPSADSWPKSGYGYSVIGDAVNPYPLLVQVC